MASYKVPQDVEADDKLIGPFSFRQFIYLLIVAACMGIAYFLSTLFLPLAVIPLPVIIFFGALALPLRKDQPMETYLAAIVSFYLKPRKRMWMPDGTQTFVEITVPKVIEVRRAKDLSQDEAERRLSYLASIVDSRGWAVRGVQGQGPAGNGVMNTDVYYEAQNTPDMLDDGSNVGVAFDNRLDQADATRHQEMLARVQRPQQQQQYVQPQPQAAQPVYQPQQIPDPYQTMNTSAPQPAPDETPTFAYNPYPAMQQSVIAPQGQQVQAPQQPNPTSEKAPSPDIINLANNPDLSVETIAREANRIHEREKLSEDEVVISLR